MFHVDDYRMFVLECVNILFYWFSCICRCAECAFISMGEGFLGSGAYMEKLELSPYLISF